MDVEFRFLYGAGVFSNRVLQALSSPLSWELCVCICVMLWLHHRIGSFCSLSHGWGFEIWMDKSCVYVCYFLVAPLANLGYCFLYGLGSCDWIQNCVCMKVLHGGSMWCWDKPYPFEVDLDLETILRLMPVSSLNIRPSSTSSHFDRRWIHFLVSAGQRGTVSWEDCHTKTNLGLFCAGRIQNFSDCI